MWGAEGTATTDVWIGAWEAEGPQPPGSLAVTPERCTWWRLRASVGGSQISEHCTFGYGHDGPHSYEGV